MEFDVITADVMTNQQIMATPTAIKAYFTDGDEPIDINYRFKMLHGEKVLTGYDMEIPQELLAKQISEINGKIDQLTKR
jgi:hypothetical protein